MLRDADDASARRRAERVRAAVDGAALPHPADPRGIVTVSSASRPGHGDAADAARARRRARSTRPSAPAATGVRARPATRRPSRPARRRTDAVEQPAAAPPARHARRLARGGRPGAARCPCSRRSPSDPLRAALPDRRREPARARPEDVRVVLVAATRRRARAARQRQPVGDLACRCSTPRTTALRRALAARRLPRLGPPIRRLDAGARARRSTPDAWDPGDALLLPLRGTDGEVLGIVSVDEPLSGRRPTTTRCAC